jgi:hypothetical protein
MLLKSLINGFARTWTHKRMTLVFYLVQLVFGLMITVPLAVAVHNFTGRTLMGKQLAHGLDLDVLASFIHYNRPGLMMMVALFILVWLLHKFMVLFLSGGAIALFTRGDRYEPGEFFGNARRYYGAFLRLVLWAVPVLIVLLGAQYIVGILKYIIWGSDARESITYWVAGIRAGLGLLGLLLAGMVFDYARVHAVFYREASMRKSIWQGVCFAVRNFPAAFGLTAALGIAGLLALWLFRLLAGWLDSPAAVLILLLFVIQQLYVLFRSFMKLALWSGEVQLFQQVQSK